MADETDKASSAPSLQKILSQKQPSTAPYSHGRESPLVKYYSARRPNHEAAGIEI